MVKFEWLKIQEMELTIIIRCVTGAETQVYCTFRVSKGVLYANCLNRAHDIGENE